MAHSLTHVTPVVATPISRKTKHLNLLSSSSSSGTFKVSAFAAGPDHDQLLREQRHVFRRSTVALGLVVPLLKLVGFHDGNALAASRRPPPPPPTEKKDPNVSGVTAKILASKKRKEAMKESIEKLREKGKPIEEPSK